MTCNSGICFTSRICWLTRANALFGKERTSGEQRPDFHNVKYFARTNFAICLATTNTTTEILHKPARSYYSYYYLFIKDKKKGKWHFCVFLSCKFKVNWVWYLSWSSAEDKLVKIQGKETETEKSLSSTTWLLALWVWLLTFWYATTEHLVKEILDSQREGILRPEIINHTHKCIMQF